MAEALPPPSRSELIRIAFLEIGIGFVVAFLWIFARGGWRLLKAKPFTMEFLVEIGIICLLILFAAVLLAVRDYRAGMKKWRTWEYRQTWGRDPG